MQEISEYLPGVLLACSALLLAIASPGLNSWAGAPGGDGRDTGQCAGAEG